MCIHQETDNDIHTYSMEPNVQYCVKCLIEKTKNLETIVVNPNSIQSTFDMNSRPWGDFTVSEIMQSGREKEYLYDHKMRILNADLSYPVLLFEWDEELYDIVDGCHRMVHATLFGKVDQIKYRLVGIGILESCVIETTDEESIKESESEIDNEDE